MVRIAVICALVAAVSTASYDNPSDPAPDAVQAFNPSHAPDPECRANEEYTQCATHCEPTCDNPTPVCIRSCATAQCQCVYGYLRNNYGECIAASTCPAATTTTTEEPTTTETPYYTTEETLVYTSPATYTPAETAAPEQQQTYEPSTEAPTAAPIYNTYDTPAHVDNTYAATEAPATADNSYSETPAPASSGDSSTDQTAAPAAPSEYQSEQNTDVAPATEDDDVIIVGGACGENSCRVGFRCDDSTAVGARCIPFDTRARSSCSEVRCRPGWSCVVAMDGPRCYRNQVLGIADAPEQQPAAAAAAAGGYADDVPAPAGEVNTQAPAAGKTCADVTCPFGLTCFEADAAFADPFCRSNAAGATSPAQLCSEVQCGSDEACADEYHGPICNKNAPATCAATSCLTGSRCVEHPEGARCEEGAGPQVFAGQTCEHTTCASMHQCFDTVDGASCYPIPVDPIEPSGPLRCSDITCGQGERCEDDEVGGRCIAQEENASVAPAADPVPTEASFARAGVSDGDCEHMNCGSGEMCAIDFEGHPYCRKEEGSLVSVAAADTPSVDPSTPVPQCSDITCPSEHECFDDAVKGAACWPVRRGEGEQSVVSSTPVTISASSDPVTCRTYSCLEAEICVEESSGPRCVTASRRGVSAPGYKRRA